MFQKKAYLKSFRSKEKLLMTNFLSPNDTVIIATHNQGKAKEFKELFEKFHIRIKLSKDFNIAEPVESGKTFKENSILKVKSVEGLKYTAVADDSGLCVEILNGKPGIFSARWAKKYGSWGGAMEKIFMMAQKKEFQHEFNAKYYCVLSVLWKNGSINCYNGQINGKIVWPPKGKKGFGYDPFFKPNNSCLTFGEMDKNIKMQIDHRSLAFKQIIKNHYVEDQN